jgi:hypothetical protein
MFLSSVAAHELSSQAPDRQAADHKTKQEHALSIAIFANYLILDTILCSIPRFLVLSLLRSFSSDLCSPSFSSQSPNQQTQTYPSTEISTRSSSTPDLPYPTGQWDSFSSSWSADGCMRIVTLAQWTLAAGVVAGTLLQFVGALYVREYARGVARTREVGRLLEVIDEEDELVLEGKL